MKCIRARGTRNEFELMDIITCIWYGESHGPALASTFYRRIADDAWTCVAWNPFVGIRLGTRLDWTRINAPTLQCPPDALNSIYSNASNPSNTSPAYREFNFIDEHTVRYLPTWLPFMGLKRHALATAELVGEVMEMPLREIKEKRVRFFSGFIVSLQVFN